MRFLYQLFGRNALTETPPDSLLEDGSNSRPPLILAYLPAFRLTWHPLPGNF